MNNVSSRSLAGAAPLSITRDIVRIVIGAVLAGTGFAILLALTVLSLTVISPPVHASGAPSAALSEPGQTLAATDLKPVEQNTGAFIGEAVAAQPLQAATPASNEAGTETLLGMPKPAAWALSLALLAGVAAFVIRARSKA